MKVLDLCAGVGVYARAFQLEDFDLVAGWEKDLSRARCYEENTGAPCHAEDVLELTADELEEWADPEETVVIGGIPCADFSHANLFAEHDTTLRDHVLSIVEEYDPAAVAIENILRGWKGVDEVQPVRHDHVGGYTIRERGFYGLQHSPPRTHGPPGQARLDGDRMEPENGWADALPGDENVAVDMQHPDRWRNQRWLPVRPGDRPSWSITCKCLSGWLLFDETQRNTIRWLELEDMARLHGLDPEAWTFPAGRGATASAIAECVPLSMGRAVARQVRREVG